jgi:hypothetical protein
MGRLRRFLAGGLVAVGAALAVRLLAVGPRDFRLLALAVLLGGGIFVALIGAARATLPVRTLVRWLACAVGFIVFVGLVWLARDAGAYTPDPTRPAVARASMDPRLAAALYEWRETLKWLSVVVAYFVLALAVLPTAPRAATNEAEPEAAAPPSEREAG